jgi:hypothetical protein
VGRNERLPRCGDRRAAGGLPPDIQKKMEERVKATLK